MPDEPHVYIILLRAIGPATHKRMSMAQWREAAADAGFGAPETLVNTGNMIATHAGGPSDAAEAMTTVLRGFGLGDNVVPIVRTPGQMAGLIAADPISEAASKRPAQTGVYFFLSDAPDLSWIGSHDGPETIHVVAKHLVVDFSRDVAKSGRLIRRIDKSCGLNTARNWNTTRKLALRGAARESE